MGIYWMWSDAEGWNEPNHKAVVEGLIPENLPPQSLWGEGAITHFFAFTWYRKRIAASPAYDEFVVTVLRDILSNKLGPTGHLPSPYYGIEDVARHTYQQFLGCDDPFKGDGFEGTSYICESLMMYLVRANLKERCKELWPNFTRIKHERVVPDEAWRFALYRTGEGATNTTDIYPSTMQWKELHSGGTQGRPHSAALVCDDLSISRLVLSSEIPSWEVRCADNDDSGMIPSM
jgi:hypothetical protein